MKRGERATRYVMAALAASCIGLAFLWPDWSTALQGQGYYPPKPPNPNKKPGNYAEYLGLDIVTKSWLTTCTDGSTRRYREDFTMLNPYVRLVTEYREGYTTEKEYEFSKESYSLIKSRSFDDDGNLVIEHVYEPPIRILTADLAPNVGWGDVYEDTNIADLGSTPKYTYYVREPLEIEDVNVPAGRFAKCLKISRHFQYNFDYASFGMSWYCPEVGLTKNMGSPECVTELEDIMY